MITIKPDDDTWFECTYWNWIVRAGNCVECNCYEKSCCPHPDLANIDQKSSLKGG